MRTPSQIEASRQNGAKSRGPKTPEGKEQSARNGFLHGLSGTKMMVIEGESAEHWSRLLDDCVLEFSPETALEWDLVVEIAAARWRMRRSRYVETALIDMEIENQREHVDRTYAASDVPLRHAAAIAGLGQQIHLMDRYETRAGRSYDRAVRNLYELRERRRKLQKQVEAFLPSEPGTAPPPAGPL